MSNIVTKPHHMSKVNLDAMIPKADFVAPSNAPKSQKFDRLSLASILPNVGENYSSIHDLLKKPDFQRETCEWDKYRIADLINSFIKGDFIPSIILWENATTGNIYVIDGAHRLSALIAYINDDYGDRENTRRFYKHQPIPDAQQELATEAREYINKEIGAFKDVINEGSQRANGMKKNALAVQWVEGDVKIAESSFFKINQQGVSLSPTEKYLCQNRDTATSLATRIIMRGLAGEIYWKSFSADIQAKISPISDQVNKMLFTPPYKDEAESIILHHPLGGSITIAMPMVLDLIKMIKSEYAIKEKDSDITDGSETLNYLNKVRKILWLILSNQNGSLGLHPSIYFYTGTGKFIQSAFLGMVELFVEHENKNTIDEFILKFVYSRKRLEPFLIKYKIFLTQLNRTYGSKARSYPHIKGFFMNLIDAISMDMSDEEIVKEMKQKENVLNPEETETGRLKGKRFTKELKSLKAITAEINATQKCYICGGFMHPLSKSFDHVHDVKFGGKSELENMEITHVYCNMSKDMLIEKGYFSQNKV